MRIDAKEPVIKEIRKQEDFLQSERYNSSIQNLKRSLDSSYDSLRVLESEEQDFRLALREKLQQAAARQMQLARQLEKRHKGFRCMFTGEDDFGLDRDGERLPTCIIRGGTLNHSLSGLAEVRPLGEVSSESSSETKSIASLPDDGLEVTKIEQAPVPGGVRENFLVEFQQPQDIDYLEIKTPGCRIESLTFVHEDGTSVDEEDLENRHVSQKDVSQISFSCVSQSYDKIEIARKKLPKKTLYAYRFIVRSIEIGQGVSEKASCAVSEPVDVQPGVPFGVQADYSSGAGSIEFYVVENNRDYPVLPLGETEIQDEKRFPMAETRFPVDTLYSYRETERPGGYYTADYTPVTTGTYTPSGDTVSLKVILRRHEGRPPCLHDIFISEKELS